MERKVVSGFLSNVAIHEILQFLYKKNNGTITDSAIEAFLKDYDCYRKDVWQLMSLHLHHPLLFVRRSGHYTLLRLRRRRFRTNHSPPRNPQ